ncbi:mediator complex, subunit Med22 [Dipodascopsis tothii]|uniref:mediator complex, subunit Med22 n=1 Tax=Dipodascopsis tothii TaxID=44089 RepID=UPI0034CF9EC2
MASQTKTASITQRINDATNQLVSEFTDIVELAPVLGKDLTTTATETYQIECHATSIVRAVEDLLSITRALKEAWLLGQMSASFQVDSL